MINFGSMRLSFAPGLGFCLALLGGCLAEAEPQKKSPDLREQIRNVKFTYKVNLQVNGNNSLSDQATSYLTRHLRAIPDILIEEAKFDYVLRINFNSVS